MTNEDYNCFCAWIDSIPEILSEMEWDIYYNEYWKALKEM